MLNDGIENKNISLLYEPTFDIEDFKSLSNKEVKEELRKRILLDEEYRKIERKHIIDILQEQIVKYDKTKSEIEKFMWEYEEKRKNAK